MVIFHNKLIPSPVCHKCGMAMETMLHVIREREKSQEIWKSTGGWKFMMNGNRMILCTCGSQSFCLAIEMIVFFFAMV